MGAIFAIVRRVLGNPLFVRPDIAPCWPAEFPAGDGLSVEERHEAGLISGADVEGGQGGERQEGKCCFHVGVRELRSELSSHLVCGLALPRSSPSAHLMPPRTCC